jgi:hypothetical protein
MRKDPEQEKEWQAATKTVPCPVCKSDHWCRFTADGSLAACRKESAGGERRTYKNGEAYFLHVLKPYDPPAQQRKPRPKKKPPAGRARLDQILNDSDAGVGETPAPVRATIDELGRAYATLLSYDNVALSEAHRASMVTRGFTAENIAKRQYRSVNNSSVDRILLKQRLAKDLGLDGISGVPGIGGSCVGLACGSGMLVPCRDSTGQIFGMKVRSDSDTEGESKKDVAKYYYLSSTKHDGPGALQSAHVPLGTPEEVDEVRGTEGEIKADLAMDLSGIPTISFPGISSWRTVLPVLEQLKVKVVRLAFDADASRNMHVATAQFDCATTLRDAGYVVKAERWSLDDGKGIDDVLAAGKPVEVLEGDEAFAHFDACVQEAQQVEEEKKAAEEAENPSLIKRVLETYGKGVAEFFADGALLYEIAAVACSDPPQYAAICEELKAHGLGTMNFRRAMKPILAKAAATAEPQFGRAEKGGFFIAAGAICRNKQTPYGPIILDLCNFTAEIIDETTLDDGAETKVVLGISGTLDDGRSLPRIEVPAEKFHDPQKWLLPGWGSDAIAWPGEIKAIPAAIQALSENKILSSVFTHTGWRKIGESWAFLHAGGAIGTEEQVKVALPDSLSSVNLPLPATHEDKKAAILASLDVLKLTGNKAITWSLLGTIYRAPLGLLDHSLFFVGRSGTYKTEVSAIGQQHFGAGFDSRHLPANWSSTGNSLEGLLFHAKDLPIVADDFAPQAGDVARLNRTAEQVFRAQGNSAGRGRMKHDGTLRQSRPPRGTVIATGEDTPNGQSILARLNIQEFSPGDVELVQLTKCQEHGALGLFAQAMAAYIDWIAPDYERVMAEKKVEVANNRARAIDHAKGGGHHARAPGIIAEVIYGIQLFLAFAASTGAISELEREAYEAEAWTCLLHSSVTQVEGQDEADPASQFIRLITSAIATGRAHLVTDEGKVPPNPMAWGWRLTEIPFSTGGCRDEWRPLGKKVGWLLTGGTSLLLDSDAAYSEAQALATSTGGGFSIRPVTLGKRLNERGYLTATGAEDGGRQTLKVRHTCEGRRQAGLEMKVETLCQVEVEPVPSSRPLDPVFDARSQDGQTGQVSDGYGAALQQETFAMVVDAI